MKKFFYYIVGLFVLFILAVIIKLIGSDYDVYHIFIGNVAMFLFADFIDRGLSE